MNRQFFALITFAVIGTTAVAFADTDLFECQVKEKGQTVKVSFGVHDLRTPNKAQLEDIKGSEKFTPIVVSPKSLRDGADSELNTLNDQGGDLRVGKTKLTLFGDGDGETSVFLVLYKSSDYTKGFVRVEHSDKKGDWYQNIHCTHQVD